MHDILPGFLILPTFQAHRAGLSLGAGDWRNLPPIPPLLKKKKKIIIYFLFKFLKSPSSVDCTSINKMIKLTKKPLNFLMQSLQ
jgi:hypothetical protein